MPYHYTTRDNTKEPLASAGHIVTTFEFYRFRFHFRALDHVHFPLGKSANVVRGAFGTVLRDAVPPEVYARLFEPGRSLGAAPSGLADWPRPFVLRVAHLDGLTVPEGDSFYLDAHVFDLHQPTLVHFRAALSRLAEKGLGPGRGRAELEWTEQLDVEGGAQAVWETSGAPIVASLDPETSPVESVTVRFQTPTELKSAGGLAERPEFPIFFGRLRDRISTLRSLYGAGALDIDFKGFGERAARIELRRSNIVWEQVKRKSGRTGQVHPIGGFTGEAEYAGHLAEFLPWLRAARWVGVGRQTVWGKGDVRVL
jgi:CRISPR-associated endoribonuclease Cas6